MPMSDSQTVRRGRLFFVIAIITVVLYLVPHVLVPSGLPLPATIALAVGSGVAMAAVLVWLHVRLSKTTSQADPPRARQVGQITLPVSMPSAVELTQAALSSLRMRAIAVSDTDPPIVSGRTRMSWKSWGEHVRVALASNGSGGVVASVSSDPAVSTTIVDYGKNRDNVRAVCSALARTSGSDTTSTEVVHR